jgi:GAF domain-containing protein
LEQGREVQLLEALSAAAEGLRKFGEIPQQPLELSRQMEILSSAIIAISGELRLGVVLQRITDLARSLVAAKYAALGVPDSQGQIATFVTAGISAEEETRIGHPPEGRGILGLLLRVRQPIRLDDLTAHPAAAGFPGHHPAMRSFLGTPIISRSGAIIGSLYLTVKRDARSFPGVDERLIELLARHAAVANENASLYQRLKAEEQRVDRILDQLSEAIVLVDPESERVVVMPATRGGCWVKKVHSP